VNGLPYSRDQEREIAARDGGNDPPALAAMAFRKASPSWFVSCPLGIGVLIKLGMRLLTATGDDLTP